MGATVLPVAANGPLQARRFGSYSLWAVGPLMRCGRENSPCR
ncbi:lysR-family transcriptional regulator [Bordetella holmesii 41130]|nr:lysR-family transcriptional regulator [Bordetella holmesii 41130]